MGRAINPQILYEGKPSFVPVEGTDVKMAVNSDDEIFQAENMYWACTKGIWMKSKEAASGWAPATEIPKALTTLPESSGVFQVRFVRPLGARENEGPSFAAAGGYAGVFVVNGTTVHGTGVTKRGVLRAIEPGQANWYPYPKTHGENRWYDPWAGVFQPRTVRYGEDGKALASEWSPYTASYGRVRHYSDRYNQGGRRMFPWNENEQEFVRAAPRPDVYAAWGTNVQQRDGIPADKVPIGDRAGETSASIAAAVVADEKGAAWRLSDKGAAETWDGKAWVVPKDAAPEDVKAWLAVLKRLQARPDQMKTWAARRNAPLPFLSSK
jgi:hypothetical protein